jgi:hypothetical protein
MKNPISQTGVAPFLTVTFLAFKLTGVANWDWVWVLSPMWISLTLLGLAHLVGIRHGILKWDDKK